MVEHTEIKSKNIESDLTMLASILNIEIVFGWKSRLAEKLNLKDVSVISTWIRRGSVPKKHLGYIESIGINRDDWKSIKLEENSKGLDTPSDYSSFQPLIHPDNVFIFEPEKEYYPIISEDDARRYANMAYQILRSGTGYAGALRENIAWFKKAVSNDKKINELKDELKEVKEELKALKDRLLKAGGS